MVVTPVSGKGPVKRGSPDSTEEYRPWEAPNMVHARHTLPHYALLYLDQNGVVRVEHSPSLQKEGSKLFTADTYEKFLSIVGNNSENVMSLPLRSARSTPFVKHDPSFAPSQFPFTYESTMPSQNIQIPSWDHPLDGVKRRKATGSNPTNEMPLEIQYIDSSGDDEDDSDMDRVPLEIGDEKSVLAYYENALKQFQQINCRLMAKAFIKFIEPRKQVKHPYNGGKAAPGAPPGQKGDPELTKPDWWPQGVIHKEPDHLRKEHRITLMIHIIRNLGSIGVTADKLREVANDTRRGVNPQQRMSILEEVFRVRKLEERLERQEVDANTIIYVVDRESGARNTKDSDDELEDENPLPLTPATTVASAPDPLTLTPTQQLGSGFEMIPDLRFEDQSRHVNAAQPSQADQGNEYHDSFTSQPLIRDHTNATVVSPVSHRSFDYVTQQHFLSPVSEEQMRPLNAPAMHPQASPAQFGGWSPSFQQNMFGPVDYNNVSRPAMSPPMAYPPFVLYPASPNHGVQTVPDLHGARTQPHYEMLPLNPPPFRTGSLSHPHMDHPGPSV